MSCASELMKMGVDIEDLRKIYLAALEWQQGYDNPDYTVREVDGLHRELLDLCRKETKKLSEIAMKRREEGLFDALIDAAMAWMYCDPEFRDIAESNLRAACRQVKEGQ